MKNETKHIIPKLSDIIDEKPLSESENNLMVILNQPPKKEWLKEHPTAKVQNRSGEWIPLVYLPIERIEWLLAYIYGGYQTEVRSVQELAQSIVITVRVTVRNPVTDKEEYQDGVGAYIVGKDPAGAQLAAPAAKTYAIKDACEQWGRIFGKDLNRAETMDYNALLKSNVVDDVSLRRLFENKLDKIHPEDRENYLRIINGKEKTSYKKIHETLTNL